MTIHGTEHNDNDLHDLVGVYVIGALPVGEAEVFERHLETCDQCQVELARMEKVLMALAQHEPVEVPEGLIDSLLAELPPQDESRVAALPSPTKDGHGPWTILAAAAAAIVIAGLAAVFFFGDDDRVDRIAEADDRQTIVLMGELDQVELDVSDDLDGVALVDEELETLENELYALWVIRGDAGPMFLGHIQPEGSLVRQSWDVDPEGATAFAISIETMREPTQPSDRIILVGEAG